VFVLQDKVIEHILAADREAEAKAAAPTAVDPIQQTVSEEIKDAIRRRSVDREKAKTGITFLAQPMGRTLHAKLKPAHEAWKASRDDATLVEEVLTLAEQFGKQNAEFAVYVEQIAETHWRRSVSGSDPRGVGVVAYHIAWGYGIEQQYISAIACGRPLPQLSMATLPDIHVTNAKCAQEWEGMGKAEVIAGLRSAAAATEAYAGQPFQEGAAPRCSGFQPDRQLPWC